MLLLEERWCSGEVKKQLRGLKSKPHIPWTVPDLLFFLNKLFGFFFTCLISFYSFAQCLIFPPWTFSHLLLWCLSLFIRSRLCAEDIEATDVNTTETWLRKKTTKLIARQHSCVWLLEKGIKADLGCSYAASGNGAVGECAAVDVCAEPRAELQGDGRPLRCLLEPHEPQVRMLLGVLSTICTLYWKGANNPGQTFTFAIMVLCTVKIAYRLLVAYRLRAGVLKEKKISSVARVSSVEI